MMRCAAMAMVCRPEEQKRLMVTPDTVTGQPAARATWRAMLEPVAPSGVAQPISTSSTSAASMPARWMACLTAWPPRVAPWVMLKAPFQLLARGVRAVETITAFVISNSPECGSAVERLAFGHETGQQRCGLPELGVVQRILRKALHALHHVEQAHGVGVLHGATAVN